MIALPEFVRRHTGRQVVWNWDGSATGTARGFGAQCVDLVRQWFEEGLGLSRAQQPEPTGNAGAVGFADHARRPTQARFMDWTPYQRGMVAPIGSVPVFGPTPGNRFGHIAVTVEADAQGLRLFSQDGFNQARGAQVMSYTYQNLLGWLTPKARGG